MNVRAALIGAVLFALPVAALAGWSHWVLTEASDPRAALLAGAFVCGVFAAGLGALWGANRGARGPAGAASSVSDTAGNTAGNTAGATASATDEAVLSALEQAAGRVASGDLVSQIGLRTGTQADRTLGAFDRMTEELRHTREKLVRAERIAAWREIAKRIAHELKNPLSPIRTSMETCRKARAKGHPDFDEIFEESSRIVLEEVDRLERIVREFSEFARLPRPKPGELDVRELAEHCVGMLKHSPVTTTLVAPDALPPIRADREQLTQVLINLLKNAQEAAAAHSAPRVELRVERTDDGVEVSVHDTGSGVPETEREAVFEPYYTKKSAGTGLGLAIAQRIATEHESVIEVGESGLGGAAFRLRLTSRGPRIA